MKLFDWSTSVSHGSNPCLPHHYCHMQRADRVFFSQYTVNAPNLTWLYMRRCPHGKVPTLMPLGELVLHMGGPLTITMPPHPGWPAPFQKHSHSVTHNRGDQVKAVRVEKSAAQCWHKLLCLGHKPRWTKQEWEGKEYQWGAAGCWQIGT